MPYPSPSCRRCRRRHHPSPLPPELSPCLLQCMHAVLDYCLPVFCTVETECPRLRPSAHGEAKYPQLHPSAHGEAKHPQLCQSAHGETKYPQLRPSVHGLWVITPQHRPPPFADGAPSPLDGDGAAAAAAGDVIAPDSCSYYMIFKRVALRGGAICKGRTELTMTRRVTIRVNKHASRHSRCKGATSTHSIVYDLGPSVPSLVIRHATSSPRSSPPQ